MKKNIFFSMLCSILILTSLIGCSNNTSSDQNGSANISSKKIISDALAYIQQINPENTVEEINKLTGVTGTLVDEQYNEYYWELSEEIGITVTYYSSGKGEINLEIDEILLANDKIDLSKYKELSPKVKEGITYDEFKSYLGNVDGTLVGKNSSTKKYKWVNKDGGYIYATFSDYNNQCTFMSAWL